MTYNLLIFMSQALLSAFNFFVTYTCIAYINHLCTWLKIWMKWSFLLFSPNNYYVFITLSARALRKVKLGVASIHSCICSWAFYAYIYCFGGKSRYMVYTLFSMPYIYSKLVYVNMPLIIWKHLDRINSERPS